jgi:hypothetical protein
MNSFTFYCIVEGEGEVQALPILLRRLFPFASVPRPARQSRDKLMRDEKFLGRQIEKGVERLKGQTGALVLLLDADDECPASDGPRLTSAVQDAAQECPYVVSLANREYESWFVAAAASLAGKRGLRQDLEAPVDPESIRGAKEWLTKQMPPRRTYAPTVHQAAFSQVFDLQEAARNSPSFRRFVDRLAALTGEIPSWV